MYGVIIKEKKYPLIIMHGTQTLLSFCQKSDRQGIESEGKKSTFAMPWAHRIPSGKFFVHLVSRLGSGWLTFVSFSSSIFFQERLLFFQCSKQYICNTGHQWLLGCREIQNTGSVSPPTQGRWKIQDKIRKFHFSVKSNSTAIRGREAGKWEDHTWIEKTENPIFPHGGGSVCL